MFSMTTQVCKRSMFYTEGRDPRTKWYGRVLKMKISDRTRTKKFWKSRTGPGQDQQKCSNLVPDQENLNRSVPGPWQGIPFDQPCLSKRIFLGWIQSICMLHKFSTSGDRAWRSVSCCWLASWVTNRGVLKVGGARALTSINWLSPQQRPTKWSF